MKLHLLTVTVVLTAALGCAACDRSKSVVIPTAPTPPATPPVVTPSVTAISIQGKTQLTAVGETTALTATASLSDGTTKNVTTAVQWSSSFPATVSITPGGLATALRLGASSVGALYNLAGGSKFASVSVQVTPPGTFAVTGRVREPGSSGIPGVQVRELTSGASMLSDPDGQYSMGALTAARLSFDKAGFEPTVMDGKPDAYNDVAMQRVIRIAAGGTVDVKLAPHDMDYAAGGDSHCYPCRMIRVAGDAAGQLHLRVAWTEPHATLNLWINGQLFEGTAHGPSEAVADVPIGAGELLVYVGMKNPVEYYAPFTLTTGVVK
jgi:hypothetical protein